MIWISNSLQRILLGDRRQAVVQAISHLLLDDDWLHESADIRNG
jgi:hypothetical protein